MANPFSFTLRTEKGSALTHQELDDNFRYLDYAVQNVSGVTGSTVDTYITGGTLSNGTLTLTNNFGSIITVTGFTGSTTVVVNSGTTIFSGSTSGTPFQVLYYGTNSFPTSSSGFTRSDAQSVQIFGSSIGSGATDYGIRVYDSQNTKLSSTRNDGLSFAKSLSAYKEFNVFLAHGTGYTEHLSSHTEEDITIELGLHKYGNTTGAGPEMALSRSRGSFSAMTLVNEGDSLGGISFVGFDGVDYNVGVRLQGVVDGPPGINTMPGRLVISTVSGGTAIERFRITRDGAWGINGINYGNAGQVITSNGFGQPPSWSNTSTTGTTSGSYLPGISAGINVSASSSFVTCGYMRVSDAVTTWGRVLISVVSGGTAEFSTSLPIASNFTTSAQFGGSAFIASSDPHNVGYFLIEADVTNNLASYRFDASNPGTYTIQFHYSYTIV